MHYPPTVMELALAAARALTQGRIDVLSTGVGFKHSKFRGYGRKGRQCVKFLVRRKRKRLAEGLALPRSISVTFRGRHCRVPTDVESLPRAIQHRPRIRIDSIPPGHGGTPSFVVTNSDGGAQRVVTAGHALLSNVFQPPTARLTHLDPAGPVGRVTPSHTYQRDQSGRVLDFGTVRVTMPQALAFYSQPPFSRIQGVMTRERLLEYERDGPQIECVGYGAANNLRVRLDEVLDDPIDFDFGGYTERYPAGLIRFRAIEGQFYAGDSGVPLVYLGQVVGVHVVGLPSDRKVGYAVCADEILQSLKVWVGQQLRVR